MTGTHCIEAKLFQQFNSSLFCMVNCSGTKRPIVVMHTSAAQFNGFTIQKKTLIRGDAD